MFAGLTSGLANLSAMIADHPAAMCALFHNAGCVVRVMAQVHEEETKKEEREERRAAEARAVKK